MTGMFLIGVGTIVGSVLLIMAVFRARATESATPIVRIALIVATIYAGLSLIGTVLVTFLWFSPSSYPEFVLPVQSYWPLPTGFSDDGSPIVVNGGFTQAHIAASGLSLGTRIFLASGNAVGGLVTTGLAALVALACFRLLQGRPFAPEISRLTAIAGVVVLIGGLAAQILSQAGAVRAGSELISAAGTDILRPGFSLSIDFWPVGVAIGLGVFAALIRYGTRLQKDTEGLV